MIDGDRALAYARRRLVFTMLAKRYDVPEGVWEEARRHDPDYEWAKGVTDEGEGNKYVDEAVDQMLDEGLLEYLEEGDKPRGRDERFVATDLLDEAGLDMVDWYARRVLFRAKARILHEQGQLDPLLAELDPAERERFMATLTASLRVDFDVHRPRHEPAA